MYNADGKEIKVASEDVSRAEQVGFTTTRPTNNVNSYKGVSDVQPSLFTKPSEDAGLSYVSDVLLASYPINSNSNSNKGMGKTGLNQWDLSKATSPGNVSGTGAGIFELASEIGKRYCCWSSCRFCCGSGLYGRDRTMATKRYVYKG